ncbi:MAG TPA: hypothetical protein ENJ93_09845 [Chloroflexi bacterium]|nr:hypothetical protein [Chloroflexota bacterium]
MSAPRIILFWETPFLHDAIQALLAEAGLSLAADFNHPVTAVAVQTLSPTHILLEANVRWQERLLPELLRLEENVTILQINMAGNQVNIFQHQANTLTQFSDFVDLLDIPATSI